MPELRKVEVGRVLRSREPDHHPVWQVLQVAERGLPDPRVQAAVDNHRGNLQQRTWAQARLRQIMPA